MYASVFSVSVVCQQDSLHVTHLDANTFVKVDQSTLFCCTQVLCPGETSGTRDLIEDLCHQHHQTTQHQLLPSASKHQLVNRENDRIQLSHGGVRANFGESIGNKSLAEEIAATLTFREYLLLKDEETVDTGLVQSHSLSLDKIKTLSHCQFPSLLLNLWFQPQFLRKEVKKVDRTHDTRLGRDFQGRRQEVGH